MVDVCATKSSLHASTACRRAGGKASTGTVDLVITNNKEHATNLFLWNKEHIKITWITKTKPENNIIKRHKKNI